ncbi:M20/M25/M40 family metallo-hydrolase [Streptococcus caprae]|uniref:M20/M25/M40 family metallo-hydrolase n=1 Tax=Streptococcus caprae TaxID=1640501 RepID=A0ABV8CVN6_9STRE
MVVSSSEEQYQKYKTDRYIQAGIQQLSQLIAAKSIFAQQIGLAEMAQQLKGIFEAAGATVIVDERYRAPFVIAEFSSPKPDAKTLIFYQHYDTVPADSDQVWTKGAPFTLTEDAGYLYGRGVDDDKGHITARLTAVQRYMAEQGSLPVNIIFIMEGAEESASLDLGAYLSDYRERLSGADLLIWEQGRRNSKGQLEITGGNKGIVTFDLSVQSADTDIHSSFGGVIESASWYLLEAIQSMRDAQGRILIGGIAEAVQPASERELELVRQYAPTDQNDLAELHGLTLDRLATDRDDFLRRLYFEPSLSIQGLSTGYLGQGVKTILPSQATAKMEMRLVPGLTPEFVMHKIEEHLTSQGFNQIRVNMTLGEEAYRSDMSAPAIQKVIKLASAFYEEGISVLPTSPGTGPMHLVYEVLEVPMASFGLGNANSRDHAGDENIAIADYVTHIELVEELIASYV